MQNCRGSIFLGTGCKTCPRCLTHVERLKHLSALKPDPSMVTEADSQAAKQPNSYFEKQLSKAKGSSAQQNTWRTDILNKGRLLEELVLRHFDELSRLAATQTGADALDGASVQIGRRHIEDAFQRANRAILRPVRVAGTDEELLKCL